MRFLVPQLTRATAAIAAATLGLLLPTAFPVAAHAETEPPTGDNNGGLNQVIDPNQQQATDRVVLDAGHIDIGPTLSTGEWSVQIHDDTSIPRFWRMPKDVAIKVNDQAKLAVPDDSNYSFLGAEPGTEMYVVPQTQKQDVIWTGWNTQEPMVLDQVDLGVTMSITAFDGPGDLSVYLQSGNFGAPEVLYTTREALPQSTWIELNTHTHANWVFSKPGTYRVQLQFEADLRDGTHVSASDTLRFSVGDATDPEEAFAAAPLEQGADAGAPAGANGQDAAGEDAAGDEGGIPSFVWWIIAGVGVVLLIAVVVMVNANAAMKRRVRAAQASSASAASGQGSAATDARAEGAADDKAATDAAGETPDNPRETPDATDETPDATDDTADATDDTVSGAAR